MRWSSGPGTRLGDEGQCDDGGPEDGKGGGLGCQPWARMSAEVWRRARLLGGSSTLARGWGPGGGGGIGAARRDEGDDCEVVPPMEPYGRRVAMERLEGTGGL